MPTHDEVHAVPERADFDAWRGPLLRMLEGIRRRTAEQLASALAGGDARVARPVSAGVGDFTFGLDVPSEEWIAAWFHDCARRTALSVLTEDRGWRHLGPGPSGEPVELSGFDHGGPRIAFDPVDGTRNLMADLRSAWTVVSFAPAGASQPRFDEVTAGIVSELPTSAAARFRTFVAADGVCTRHDRACDDGSELARRVVRSDDDDRVDHGYFPFFRYEPAHRPALAELEAAFFERLRAHEDADLRSVYDDQYISNAGQLVLLASGTYRLVVDARALVAERLGARTVTSKPYDVAGAIVCARAAGAVVTGADTEPLDFPIDATTPVHMAGFANRATFDRLAPHWRAVLSGD